MNKNSYKDTVSGDLSISELESKAKLMRIEIIRMIHSAGSGHAGGSLSVCELLSVLYFMELNIDPQHPKNPERDRLILSKGHAAPALYAALALKGFFPVEELGTLRKIGSRLQGHPDMNKLPGIDISSGSLGMGISFGIGTSIAAKLNRLNYRTYVIVGDGELNEGQNWEAFMAASKFKLDNLMVIVDYNKVQLDGSNDDIMPLHDLKQKFKAFNWNVLECNGHNVKDIIRSFGKAKEIKNVPSVLMAHTVKGKGISYMEHKYQWHGAAIDKKEYEIAMKELGG